LDVEMTYGVVFTIQWGKVRMSIAIGIWV